MNVIQFTGNVGSAEMREVNGKDVLNFSVAVRQGISRDAPTEWMRCAIWGNQANALKDHITKGAKVAVVGRLKIGSYKDKPQYDVDVLDIDPWCGGKRDEQSGERPAQKTGSAAQSDYGADSFDTDLDDDVPFVSCDHRLDRRVS